jgi:hypothetical protein
MSDDRTRLAVLIDADNTSPKLITEMFEELASYGTITVKRAHGDWTSPHLNGWRAILLGNAISPQQQFAYTYGKNATDSALIIDAMDLLYSGNVEGFAIVSSDSDFTPLATRLRVGRPLIPRSGSTRPARTACAVTAREPSIWPAVVRGGGKGSRADAEICRRLSRSTFPCLLDERLSLQCDGHAAGGSRGHHAVWAAHGSGHSLRSEISSDRAIVSASMVRSPSPRRSRACRRSLRELVDVLCAEDRSGSAWCSSMRWVCRAAATSSTALSAW